jgi:hypothetical protein
MVIPRSAITTLAHHAERDDETDRRGFPPVETDFPGSDKNL